LLIDTEVAGNRSPHPWSQNHSRQATSLFEKNLSSAHSLLTSSQAHRRRFSLRVKPTVVASHFESSPPSSLLTSSQAHRPRFLTSHRRFCACKGKDGQDTSSFHVNKPIPRQDKSDFSLRLASQLCVSRRCLCGDCVIFFWTQPSHTLLDRNVCFLLRKGGVAAAASALHNYC